MGKRQMPKSALRQRIVTAYAETQPSAKTEPERPGLPDYPLFVKGPVRADKHGTYIWGVDQFGGSGMLVQCRGWGYLTGHGQALALDGATAIAAQKKTLAFIAEAINEKLTREGYLKEDK